MYILFDKETKKVIGINNKPFVSYTSNLELAEYYGEIPKNDYLTAMNERQETKTFTEIKYEPKLDENGNYVYGLDGEIELVSITEEKEKTYLTCDLLANFYPPKTEEQLALEKEKKYSDLVSSLIRKKYSQSAVEAIYANFLDENSDDDDIAEFNAFQEYRKECKAKAKQILNM